MKFSRLFLLSVFLCFVISMLSAFLMIRFVMNHVDTSPIAGNVIQKPGNEDSQPMVISPKIQDLESGVKAVAKKVSPSVVSIVISKEVQTYKTDPFGFFYEPAGTVKKTVGGGTGFFISKDGYILTNKHVVGDPNAQYSVILSNGQELIGKVLAFDPTTDLAIIRAYKDTVTPYSDAEAVKFIDNSGNIEVGSFVVAIGNALAQFQNTLTLGVVSGLGRQIEAGDQMAQTTEVLSGLIQTDTAINPGNSG
jgi:serine protease Do